MSWKSPSSCSTTFRACRCPPSSMNCSRWLTALSWLPQTATPPRRLIMALKSRRINHPAIRGPFTMSVAPYPLRVFSPNATDRRLVPSLMCLQAIIQSDVCARLFPFSWSSGVVGPVGRCMVIDRRAVSLLCLRLRGTHPNNPALRSDRQESFGGCENRTVSARSRSARGLTQPVQLTGFLTLGEVPPGLVQYTEIGIQTVPPPPRARRKIRTYLRIVLTSGRRQARSGRSFHRLDCPDDIYSSPVAKGKNQRIEKSVYGHNHVFSVSNCTNAAQSPASARALVNVRPASPHRCSPPPLAAPNQRNGH